MSFFDGNNDQSYGGGGQDEGVAPASSLSDLAQDAPNEDAPAAEPVAQDAQAAEPAPVKPKRARSSRPRAKKSDGVSVRDVREVLDARARLDDPRLRAALSAVSSGDDDASLVVAYLGGGLKSAGALLVAAHDAESEVARSFALFRAVDADAASVKTAAKVAVALDASLAEALDVSSGRPLDLAEALARVVGSLDVEALR